MDLFDSITGGEPIQVEVNFNQTEIALIGAAILVAVFGGVWLGITLSK